MRYFEFLIGSFAALEIRTDHKLNRKLELSKIYSTFSLILILFSILFLDSNSKYPFLFALFPCLSAFLLIKSGSDVKFFNRSIVHKLLSYPFLTKIGKISYSIYLVHFPIIFFSKLYIDNKIILIFTSLILTFIASILLYNFIEYKFRYKKLNSHFYKSVVPFIFIGSLVLIINYDFKYLNANGKNLFKQLEIEQFNRSSFKYKEANLIAETEASKINVRHKELDTILIVGDSHADNILMVFSDNFYNFKDYVVKKIHVDTICLNSKHKQKITGYLMHGLEHKGTCQVQIQNLVAAIKKNNIKLFILSNYYNPQTILYFEPYVDKYFNKKNVIIIPQVVDFINFNKNILFSSELNLNKNISNNISKESLEIRKKMIIYAKNNHINYFDINRLFCTDKNFCKIYDIDAKKFFFVDASGHISFSGTRKIKFDFLTYLNSAIH